VGERAPHRFRAFRAPAARCAFEVPWKAHRAVAVRGLSLQPLYFTVARLALAALEHLTA
jgi:hypothetical protein